MALYLFYYVYNNRQIFKIKDLKNTFPNFELVENVCTEFSDKIKAETYCMKNVTRSHGNYVRFCKK